MQKKIIIKAFAALFLLTLIWGYNWVLMKLAVQYASPFQFAALRTFLGALMLFLVLFLTKRPLKLQEFPTMLLLGILQTCGFTGLLIWALVSGGAGKTAVLSYTMPFWVMLFAWPILGEKVQGWQWLAVVFALFGIVLIFDPLHIKGDGFSMTLALLSGISWAISRRISMCSTSPLGRLCWAQYPLFFSRSFCPRRLFNGQIHFI
jgi:drug/metabolite transporter (DMT)-like permease